MRPYVNLHNHTTGSIGDGIIYPKELIDAVKEAGQTAVAVTDHGSCSALWDSYKAAKKADIKLIAGCEAYFVENSNNDEDTTLRHLILLAKNATGYKNLLTLNKKGFDKFTVAFKRAIPRIDWDLLGEYHEGLICTSACGNGVIGQFIMADQLGEAKAAAKRFQSIFGDDFALELQPHNLQRRPSPYSGAINQQKINMALKRIGQELGIRCIVTTDAHYLKKEHHNAHDVYICIASGQPKSSGNRLIYDKQEFYVKDSDQIFEHFSRHIPLWGEEFVESLFQNTIYYAEQCEISDWIDPAVSTGDKNQLPEFPYKDEPDLEEFEKWKTTSKLAVPNVAEDALFYRYRSEIGLEQKIKEGKIPEEDREGCYAAMQEEFDVLEFRNFSSYMLIVAGFLKWGRENGVITSAGRGSAGGSLTAYLNDIHKAYPKKYGLIFARFLNKYKSALPDIDSDVAPSGRDKIYGYLCGKYGQDNVCHVSNVNTITPKVYARDISRVFEFGGQGRTTAVEIGNGIADSIPSELHTVKQALEEAPLFAEYAKQYPELVEFSELLCGLPRAWSTHAGGIIVAKFPLVGLVPLRRDVSGSVVLEYDKELAEENTLVKIDILGLETLDIIANTYKIIRDGGEYISDDFDYEINDEKTYKLISDGDTFGIFQLGATAVHVCKKVKPKNIDDIALVSALVRPAVKDIIPSLLKVRNGEDTISLIHPSLHAASVDTYGFVLFEESLLKIAEKVANWDLANADKLRKLTKQKGKNPELVRQWKEEFISDSIKNNIPEDISIRIWNEVIQSFGGYGFTKSLEEFELINVYTYDGVVIGSKSIKDILPGEFVRSRDELSGKDIFIEVIDKYDHGELDVVEVKLNTGEKVKCTMNHKFRVKETGEMISLYKIIECGLSIVVG